MTVSIHHGDSRSGRALNLCIRPSVTGLAQGYEVPEFVCWPVVVKEPERHDVVNVHSGRPAMLAGGRISRLRLSLLGRPVRAAMMGRSPLELWVKLADARSVATLSRAVEPSPAGYPARGAGQGLAAAYAAAGGARDLAGRHRGVLAGGGAVLAATMPRARRRDKEPRPAVSASCLNRRSAAGEKYCG